MYVSALIFWFGSEFDTFIPQYSIKEIIKIMLMLQITRTEREAVS